MRIALGVGSNTISNHDHERKSISVERTFGNTKDPEELFAICKRLCENLAEDVSERELMGKTVTLKLKLSTFDVKTRAASSGRPISTFEQIHEKAVEILKKEMSEADGLELRLMGVRLSNLTSKPTGNIQQFFVKKSYVGDSADCAVLSEPEANKSVDDDVVVVASSSFDPVASDGSGSGRTAIHDDSSESKPSPPVSAAQSSSPSMELAFCPVCQHKLPGSRSLDDLNAHIDDCLSRKTIAEVVSEENSGIAGQQTIAEVVSEENSIGRTSSSISPGSSGSGEIVGVAPVISKGSDAVEKDKKQKGRKKKKEVVKSQSASSGSADAFGQSTPDTAVAAAKRQKKTKKPSTPPNEECVKMRRLEFYYAK
uniref:DNA-directed DNA polymerase n=1 Tax=Plectus sambesii TaxID=2011161 RepID=A0A914UL93_9BILA